MTTPATLNAFVTKHLAPIFRGAGFVRSKPRLFLKAVPPLEAGAYVLAYEGRKHFNVRFSISMPQHTGVTALATADLSHLAFGRNLEPAWRWPMVRGEEEVADSIGGALRGFGVPWCERLLTLGSLRDQLEAERPCPNRAFYLSHVHEQMGEHVEALFWWQEYCQPERAETKEGTPARARLELLTMRAGAPH